MSATFFDCPTGLILKPAFRFRRRKKLRAGYTFSTLEDADGCFFFSAVTGASRIPGLFRDFCRFIPEEIFLILECYESNPRQHAGEPATFYSPYLEAEELLEDIEPFLPRLVHDGFVGFGVANNRYGMEFFYSEDKVLTCFTGNHIQIMDMMARHDIPFDPALVYPDEFPHDHLSLTASSRGALPAGLAELPDTELDSQKFCADLIDLFEMYPVDDSMVFFLSKKEQDLIEEILSSRKEFQDDAEEDFGDLLLDWNLFVEECEGTFEGGLQDYRENLHGRNVIQYVMENSPTLLADKIRGAVREADQKFRSFIQHSGKRLDLPAPLLLKSEPFWYNGVVRKPGASLRRDLIRKGWYKP